MCLLASAVFRRYGRDKNCPRYGFYFTPYSTHNVSVFRVHLSRPNYRARSLAFRTVSVTIVFPVSNERIRMRSPNARIFLGLAVAPFASIVHW